MQLLFPNQSTIPVRRLRKGGQILDISGRIGSLGIVAYDSGLDIKRSPPQLHH